MTDTDPTDHAVLPPKECRQVLYMMLKNKYLSLQEVPRSNDRVPSRTIFLWKVDYDSVVSNLTDEILKSIWNVKQKFKSVLKDNNDLIKMFETTPDILTEAQEAQIATLKTTFDRLDLVLQELDKALLIIRDI